MVQSFNLAGILFTLRAIFNRKLLRPQLKLHSFTDVNFDHLKSKGIQVLIFDKDNCITEPYAFEIYSEYKKHWQKCLNEFGKDHVYILSNSTGCHSEDPGYQEALQVENSLGVQVIRHQHKKPDGGKEVLEVIKQKHPQCRPDQIAMLGDRLLTDVLFGNLNGFYSVYFSRVLNNEKDNKIAAMIRYFEHLYLGIR